MMDHQKFQFTNTIFFFNVAHVFHYHMIDYKKFFLYEIILVFLFIFITIFLSLYGINEKFVNIAKDKNFLILKYQKDKIYKKNNIDSIFFGDSSLGNAINIKLFNNITNSDAINVALSDSYGFAGQYNLLKIILETNKKQIKKIYIFNSFFFLNTDLEDEAYFISSSNILDFFEAKNKIQYLINYYKYFWKFITIKLNFNEFEYSVFEKNSLYKDFIKQKEEKKLSINIKKPTNLKNKLYYFSKLVDLSKENNIEIIVLKGPIYKNFFLDNQSKMINENFYEKFKKIKIIDEIVFLNENEVGDFPSHVDELYKDLFTKKYINILKKNNLL